MHVLDFLPRTIEFKQSSYGCIACGGQISSAIFVQKFLSTGCKTLFLAKTAKSGMFVRLCVLTDENFPKLIVL